MSWFVNVIIVILSVFVVLSISDIQAQSSKIDSLEKKLSRMKRADTAKVNVLIELSHNMRQRNPAKAVDYALKAQAIADRIPYKLGLARSYHCLGFIAGDKRNFNDAITYFMQSQKLYDEINDLRRKALVEQNIGAIYDFQKQYSLALSYYNMSKQIYHDNRDTSGEAASSYLVGNIYMKQKDYLNAKKYLELSLALIKERWEKGKLALLLSSLGEANRKLFRFEKAAEYLLQSLKLYEELNYPTELAMIRDDLSSLYWDLDEYDKHLALTRSNNQYYEKIGDKSKLAPSYINVGNCYWKLGNHHEALKYYQQGLTLFKEFNDDKQIALVHNNIGFIKTELGDYIEALKHLLISLENYTIVGDKTGIARTNYRLGVIFHRQKMFKEAQTKYEKSNQLARELGLLDVLRDSESELAVISCTQGDYWTAYNHLVEHMKMKDSLNSLTNIKSINEMTAKYESEKKEQQIALLEKDKALQASELERKQKELALQQLEAIRMKERALLLTQQNEINLLALDHRTTELELRTKELLLQRAEKEKKAKEVELQASIISREKVAKDAMLIGVVLIVALAFLVVKRMQAKRREASLRAEAAEYQAQAATLQAQASEAELLRIQAESERRQRQVQQEFSRQLIRSQEGERTRIASELHDAFGQELVVIRNQLLQSMKSGRVEEHVLDAAQTASTMLENVRRIARDLKPVQLERYGLTNALESMITRMDKSSKTRFTIEIDPLDDCIPHDDEINVFRIVQEGTNNIVRHAEATEATVRIVRSDDLLEMLIADNGRGFDIDEAEHSFGLIGMQQRVALLGGTLAIESTTGAGSRIRMSIPLRSQPVAAASSPHEHEH